MNYIDFLQSKQIRQQPSGLAPSTHYARLFEWQRAVEEWALKNGKAALFEDCGLGKTAQQLAFADEVAKQTGKPVLILAPLAVSAQTRREGEKFNVRVNICEVQADVKRGVNITNYEKLDRFDTSCFSGVVLDESSILKSYMGKTKRAICEAFRDTPYKLACTATPAPNDLMELLNHAEFLGIMRSSEALSVWFAADQSNSGTYKLKGHAQADFWQWVSTWAVCIETPSDIGYSDNGYRLPPLTVYDEITCVSEIAEDFSQGFMREVDMSATGFYKEKSRTVHMRAQRCAEIATMTQEQYMIWCDTNEEADALKRLLPEAVEIRGSDKAETKERAAMDFVDGKHRVMISKPSIFGFGLNFQNCRNCVFCGLDYSYEKYYQAVRRFLRFGQEKPVNVWRVLGSTEKNILTVMERKQKQKEEMARGMAEHMRGFQTQSLGGHAFRLDLAVQTIAVPPWIRSEVC